MVAYRDVMNVALDELAGSYPVVKELKQSDATTLVGRLHLPRLIAGERLVFVRYDGDGRVVAAGSTGAPRIVDVRAASSFLLLNIGDAISGLQMSIGSNRTVDGVVRHPLVGDEPFPAVPDPIVRWMVGQAVRGGAIIAALTFYTALCDAGVADAQANALVRRGFRRYNALLEDCEPWCQAILRRGRQGDASASKPD